jgi:acetyl-CoA carboxylase biotin carboxylase subunit
VTGGDERPTAGRRVIPAGGPGRVVPMFRKILIANRGEVALRIIRACREMGIQTVAVYSQADADSLHVRLADEAICIGPPENARSYLNIPAIIAAAEIADVDAIHPGYGFLSEHVHFAEICESCRIRFIGPSPRVMSLMADKAKARRFARKSGLPIVPGTRRTVKDETEGLRMAQELGFPVIIKAAAGGGGKGMRVVHNEASFGNSFLMASSEAGAAFGSSEVYIEKYIQEPRHIEFQIMADVSGNVVHLGERDCTLQRRHQKLLEEAPSPSITPRLRKEMGELAVSLAQKMGYTGAGTVEFLLDRTGTYYFIEMNTRIQVEHPITEEITGIDIVKEQLRIATGLPLSVSQKDVILRGHAIECRINAEDPDDFRPCPGLITAYHEPGGFGVRVDSFVYSGYRVQPYYDSLVAKLIVRGANRAEALARMRRALDEFIIEGIKTNILFHRRIITHPDFVSGKVTTSFLENYKGTVRVL